MVGRTGSLFLKASEEGASTVSDGREFQLAIIRGKNEYLYGSQLALRVRYINCVRQCHEDVPTGYSDQVMDHLVE